LFVCFCFCIVFVWLCFAFVVFEKYYTSI
jgi:hypothetical protein